MTPTTEHRRQIGTLGQLTTLVDAARRLRAEAIRCRLYATAGQVSRIALTLDAARTHLVEDATYAAVASAFIPPAADRLVCHAVFVGKARRHARP